MPGWIINVAALLFSFLGGTVYFQHQHNIDLHRELTAAEQALSVADAQMKADRDNQQKAAELDKKYTEQLADAQTQIDKLRSDVISGNKRLRIKAQCVPDNTASRSLGVNSAIELSPAVGSTVLDIRSGIISDQAKLRYLNEHWRQMSGYIQEINKKRN